MPIYWFQLDVAEAPPTVIQRVQSLVGPEPKLSTRELFLGREERGGDPVFLGSVRELSFSIRRYIRYRNSFLPMIRGRLTPIETGTRVSVTMFIHPAVAAFMLFWLTFVGRAALMLKSQSALVPAGMFVFGVALVVGAFFPEAIKARRLLVAALKPAPQPYISARPIG